MRTLYRHSGERCVVPLEGRAGIVAGGFTPRAARQALWAVAHLTPQETAGLFSELGGMSPSKSSLDRLPKAFGAQWEAEREAFEAQLREGLTVPPTATTVAVSLDGVMTPMKDASRSAKREATFARGKHRQGPAGYQEAGCATVSFYDVAGERLSSVCMARMPEATKATLKTMLENELAAVLRQRPELTLVKVADGAKDNWRYLSEALPAGAEVVDFYHAAAHLKDAFDAAYGENTPRARANGLRPIDTCCWKTFWGSRKSSAHWSICVTVTRSATRCDWPSPTSAATVDECAMRPYRSPACPSDLASSRPLARPW
jgi:hypothetical protein